MKYPKGHEFEFKPLQPSQIKCDPLYQRNLDKKKVAKIVNEFNGDTFREPKVSYRDGSYWVFDGQHSINAWKLLHNGEDKMIMCKVFKGMTWLDECEAFVRQNGIATDPTTNEKLRSQFNAKNPEVVSMVNIATLCGFIVDFNSGQIRNRIVATSTLYKSFKKLGPDAFLDMMTALREAWDGDIYSISNQIISGMTAFYNAYYGHFKRDDLVKSLKNVSPSEIIRNGRQFSYQKNTYARQILKYYNLKRRTHRFDIEALN